MSFEFLKHVFAPSDTPDAAEQRTRWKDASSIEAEVRSIIAEALNTDVESVTLATNSYDEGDSVGNVEIIMQCEETFGLEIPDETAERLATVGQIVVYVQQQLGIEAETQ